MARPPTVSVLVPCYNKEAHLEETLASVYAQTSSDWELIVVDDGSSDGSAEILQRHQSRLRAISQQNRGASAARDRALGEATGRYIQYLDADDLLLPNALAERVTALERAAADVAYSDWQRLRRTDSGVFARGEVVARRIEDVDPDAEIACFTAFWSPPAALLYSRRIVERIGGWNASLPVIQDARYLLDAALAGAKFVRVPSVSALYREGQSDSLSRRSSAAFIADVVCNADQVAAVWRGRGGLSASQRTALAGCYDYAARGTFRHDPALFEHCLSCIAALDHARLTSWPQVARLLERGFGKRIALTLLDLLGRAAP